MTTNTRPPEEDYVMKRPRGRNRACRRGDRPCQGLLLRGRRALLRGSGFALPFRDGTLPLVMPRRVLLLFDADARFRLMLEVRRVLGQNARFVFDLLRPGVTPIVATVCVPNVAVFLAIAHTRFFVVRKP